MNWCKVLTWCLCLGLAVAVTPAFADQAVQIAVKAPNGTQLTDATVLVLNADGTAEKATLSANGFYVVTTSEQKIEFEVSHPVYGSSTGAVALPAGDKAGLNVRIGDAAAHVSLVAPATGKSAAPAAEPSKVSPLFTNTDYTKLQAAGKGMTAKGKVRPAGADSLMHMLDSVVEPRGGGGDDCGTAVAASDGINSGDLGNNSASGVTDCGFNNTIDDWWSYTATADGMVTATTCTAGTEFDTILSVFDACGGTELDCNDDTTGSPPECDLSGANRKSTVTWAATNGSTYFLRVSVFNDNFACAQCSGTLYELDITGPMGGGGGGTGADDCANADAIGGDGTFDFDNSAATVDGVPNAACDFFSQDDFANDVWFCWTADCDGDVTIQTCGLTSVDTRLAVFDGCGCPEGTGILACSDDDCGAGALQSSVTFTAVGGNSYLIRLGTWPFATGGTGQFSVTTSPACGGGGGLIDADDCANAVALSGEGLFDFDNSAATVDGVPNALCDFFSQDDFANDVWACWTAPCDGTVTIETCGLTTVDTRLAVFDGCSCPEGSGILACSDDDCGAGALQSSVMFTATMGNQYLIRLGTWPFATGGTGQLSISCAGGGGGGSATDNCSDAETMAAISGPGNYDFDTSGASTDGIPNALCDAFGESDIENDVWFCWTAECDGLTTIQSCGLTGVDTRIAVYDGCSPCPEANGILACNDDACGGLQSSVALEVVNGNQYLIRIGQFPGAAGGAGQINISDCSMIADLCMEPEANCQDFATDNASQSNSSAFTSADDFSPLVDGDITDVCWWGAYLPAAAADDFTITYYADGGGFPGAVIGGPFSQSGATLSVMGPADTGQLVAGQAPIWEYTGTHAAVSVTAGECYWISIKNDPAGSTWFWEWSFDGDARKAVDDLAVSPGFGPEDIVLNESDFAWCTNLALGDFAPCLPPPAMNDDCADATAIAGVGTYPFDNSAATTDGLADPLCDAFGESQIENDVWFCWTSDCDGLVTVQTCGLTGVDTRIAVYDGCACPTGAGILACNDDACGGALQSSVSFDGVSGNTYLIRIGTFPGAAGGAGSFDISCTIIQEICMQPDTNCQDFVTDNASQSNSAAFTSADDFVPAADGDITDICWWGAYLPAIAPDDFTVTYYADAGGYPGAVIGGPFSQSGATLSVMGPADTGQLVAGQAPIYEYTGTHAPVSVTAGECVWISVKNDPAGTTWFWEWSFEGDFRKAVDDLAINPGFGPEDIVINESDFAWCINLALGDYAPCLPPPAMNDDCADAEAIAGEGTFAFDNSAATTDGLPDILCDAFGSQQIENDVWFCWTAPCDGPVQFATCGLTGVDTKIAVYDGCTCPTGNGILACNDDSADLCSGTLQSSVVFVAVAGNEYLLRVGTFPGAAGGVGAFSMECLPPPPPNDLCEDAIMVSTPSITMGTTDQATIDDQFPTCVTTITAPGVWYTVVGTGNMMTASLCNAATEGSYDPKLNVYCQVDCNDPASATCVTGIDDNPACGFLGNGFPLPFESWCSQAGATYYILVQGFNGSTGPFELEVIDDGVPCSDAIDCLLTGACCLPNGTCIDGVTPVDCEAQGGMYQGDFTSCQGPFLGYSASSCNNPFEDISATGTALALPDDGGQFISIGFTFNFFGDDYTDIAVGSNGYLTFSGDDLSDLSQDPIPTATLPNNIIAVLWDDLDPANVGSPAMIQHELLGAPGSQRLVIQYTDVPEFPDDGANTVQAVLYEGSNVIELRYMTISTVAFVAGVENATGTEGVDVSAMVAEGACIRIEPSYGDPLECPIACQASDCAPGTIPLVDAEGDFAGWCVSTNQPTNVDIFVDAVEPGEYALIEISKDFTGGTSGLNSILLDFLQVCDDENTANMIFIADESVTNLTGIDWTDFHFILFDGPEAWFDIAASSDFSCDPFLLGLFEDLLDANRAKRLDCVGGVVPTGTSFFPGIGSGELKIGIDLSGDDPVSFTLKEIPTSEAVVHLSVTSNAQTASAAVFPDDVFGAGNGTGMFYRFFNSGTQVTVTADAAVGNRPFLRWKVNGVLQPMGQLTVDVDMTGDVELEAVYKRIGMVDTPIRRHN